MFVVLFLHTLGFSERIEKTITAVKNNIKVMEFREYLNFVNILSQQASKIR